MADRARATSAYQAPLVRLRSSALYGRLRARLPRYAFFVVVVVMCAAGVRSILLPGSSGSSVSAASPPDYAEQSFALAFARAFLGYDAAHPDAREAALAPYASSGLDVDAGFSPPTSGLRRVVWAEVAQVQRPLAGGEIVTVATQLSDEAKAVYLSVPVARNQDGAIYLAAYPSFVGPPLTTTEADADENGEVVDDPEVTALVRRALGNYLAGDAENLSADLADAATVTLPTNHLRLEGLDRLTWVSGSGGGAVLATLIAAEGSGGSYTLRYEVGVRRITAVDPRLGPGWRVTYVQTLSQES